MPARLKQLLAPLVGLLLVAACAAPSAPATTAPGRPTYHGPRRRRANDRAEAGGFTSASCAGHGAFSVGSSCATDKTGQLASGRAERSASSTGGAAKPAAGPVSGEIVVFAASSLTDVFQDMATAFQQANPNAKLTFNFGASSQLATQLGQGAKADVFASADQTQMDNAKKADAIGGQDVVFARNRLVVITPKDNPKQITAVKDLAKDGVKFVTAQPTVPIGQYTAQMLDKAVADPAYGADFKSKVEANTVSKEDNVRQVVSKVQLGEADAASRVQHRRHTPGARPAPDHPGAGPAADAGHLPHRRRQRRQRRRRRSVRSVRRGASRPGDAGEVGLPATHGHHARGPGHTGHRWQSATARGWWRARGRGANSSGRLEHVFTVR